MSDDRIREAMRESGFRCGGSPGKPGRYEIRNWLPGVNKSAPCPGCPDCDPSGFDKLIAELNEGSLVGEVMNDASVQATVAEANERLVWVAESRGLDRSHVHEVKGEPGYGCPGPLGPWEDFNGKPVRRHQGGCDYTSTTPGTCPEHRVVLVRTAILLEVRLSPELKAIIDEGSS